MHFDSHRRRGHPRQRAAVKHCERHQGLPSSRYDGLTPRERAR
jgi:hypothetical protein